MPTEPMNPLVVYGLRQWSESSESEEGLNKYDIIFARADGPLIPMQKPNGIFQIIMPNPDGSGYELRESGTMSAESARQMSEQVYQIACSLEHIDGLYCLYISPHGLVARGEEHMVERAPSIMGRMRNALEDACGPIEFHEVAGDHLFLPINMPA